MKPILNGTKTLIDPQTGEAITVQDVLKKVSGNYFWKIKMMDFLNSIDVLGDKSMRVYSFILGHINQRTNKLKMSNRQIRNGIKKDYLRKHGKDKKNKKRGSKGTISLSTISSSISKLEHIIIKKNGKPLLMRKRYGKYGRHSYLMINPSMLMRGSEGKRQGLLIQYDNVDSKENKAKRRYKRRQQRKHNLNKQQQQLKKIKHHENSLMKKINAEQKDMKLSPAK